MQLTIIRATAALPQHRFARSTLQAHLDPCICYTIIARPHSPGLSGCLTEHTTHSDPRFGRAGVVARAMEGSVSLQNFQQLWINRQWPCKSGAVSDAGPWSGSGGGRGCWQVAVWCRCRSFKLPLAGRRMIFTRWHRKKV